VVDAISKRHGIGPWRRRFQGVAAEGSLGGTRALLLLPGTYMNDSGRSVAEAAHFYKLGLSDIVVFHDEIDLAPGKVRVKTGGGVAGHNGLRSISAHVGNDYRRVRIGVGHPGVKDHVHAYVLSDFAKDERPWVEALCGVIADTVDLLGKGQDASFQNRVHLAMRAKGFFDAKEPDASGEQPRAG
jgi:peptidyl-tRNA hydrolase, PTH1 family